MSETIQSQISEARARAAELTRPLRAAGRRAGARTSGALSRLKGFPFARIGLGFSAAFIVSIGAYIALVHDPYGGEPVAVSVIVPGAVPDPEDGPAGAASSAARRGPATAGELEKQAGVTVVRSGGGDAPGSVVISIGDPAEITLTAAPDPRVSETSRAGILPRIGTDGSRPMDVYARPATALPGGAAPAGRIAIVVSGLGISQSATGDALARLPRAVTLAFAPYGGELDRNVAAARSAGHEVMLQVPMEPFDYPDNDPGPHTLRVQGRPAENLDRLTWLMARFPGYVGLVNFMGARLTADEAALTPILKAIGERGLFFFDDGSSARSVAKTAAERLRVPALRADRVLDAVPNAAAIDAALAALEEKARNGGLAIGTASALPVSVERIARWSATLEKKGILLVPVSAAARGKP